MSAEAVDARLREVARLSAGDWERPALIDMSAAAVSSRLLELAEISALSLALEAAGPSARDSNRQ